TDHVRDSGWVDRDAEPQVTFHIEVERFPQAPIRQLDLDIRSIAVDVDGDLLRVAQEEHRCHVGYIENLLSIHHDAHAIGLKTVLKIDMERLHAAPLVEAIGHAAG